MQYPHAAILHTAHGRLSLQLARAERFDQRLTGLIGYPWWKQCPPRHGLWLPHCRSVHGLGLGAPLLLLYCIDLPGHDTHHPVVGTDILRPGRISACRQAAHTLEMAPDSWHPGQVQAGDWLEWCA